MPSVGKGNQKSRCRPKTPVLCTCKARTAMYCCAMFSWFWTHFARGSIPRFALLAATSSRRRHSLNRIKMSSFWNQYDASAMRSNNSKVSLQFVSSRPAQVSTIATFSLPAYKNRQLFFSTVPYCTGIGDKLLIAELLVARRPTQFVLHQNW